MALFLPLTFALLITSVPVLADIKFEEVTSKAGVHHSGATQGASWGDFNGDGWPDLWVGNHYQQPSLYLNKRDGTFTDIISSVWSANPQSDKHGAAWADFDNDGDQDLFVMIGAVQGRGVGAKYLFVNENGILADDAERRGLSYPFGRGRTPLWFDADRDGRLDLLLMTTPRPDHKGPSMLFRQGENGFEPYNQQARFLTSPPSGLEKLRYLMRHLTHVGFSLPTRVQAPPFAQLADLTGDGSLDLVAFSAPTRLYSLDRVPFEDFTADIGFPSDPDKPGKVSCPRCFLSLANTLSGVTDAAIGDFNGDGSADIYFARPKRPDSDVAQVTPTEIRGTFGAIEEQHDERTLHFRTRGEVTFHVQVPWEGESNPYSKPLTVAIGSDTKQTVTEQPLTLSPSDPRVMGQASGKATDDSELAIQYATASGEWTLKTTGKAAERRINFILRATEAMDQVRTDGLQPVDGEGADMLMLRSGKQFISAALPNRPANESACNSVAAGDFDNDMDLDIFLACTGAVANVPNRLLENDGRGNFREVPMAGGASGSVHGRGDAIAIADYDRDGFLDLFVTNGFGPEPFSDDGPHQLFRNQGGGNHWIEVDLEGTTSNRDGIGASIVLESGGVAQVRGQGGGMHHDTQNHQRIHFGLGPNTSADRLTIRWPSGISQELRNIPADQIIRVKEAQSPQSEGLDGG